MESKNAKKKRLPSVHVDGATNTKSKKVECPPKIESVARRYIKRHKVEDYCKKYPMTLYEKMCLYSGTMRKLRVSGGS